MPFQSFRLSLRFVLPLALVLGLFAYAVVPLMDSMTLRWFVRDLDIRSQLLANTLQDPLLEYIPKKSRRKITQLFERAIQDERLYALAFCDPGGTVIYKTATYPELLGCWMPLPGTGERQSLVHLPQGSVHVAESMLNLESQYLGKLILVHDMSFIERRSADTRKYVISLFAVLAVLISLITVFIAHLSWRGWFNAVRGILRGDFMQRAEARTPPEMQPLIGDLRTLLHEINLERQELDTSSQVWTDERLRSLLQSELAGDQVLVVSTRSSSRVFCARSILTARWRRSSRNRRKRNCRLVYCSGW